jgi:hypothetical protein
MKEQTIRANETNNVPKNDVNFLLSFVIITGEKNHVIDCMATELLKGWNSFETVITKQQVLLILLSSS